MYRSLCLTLLFISLPAKAMLPLSVYQNVQKIISSYNETPNSVWPNFHFNDYPTIVHDNTPFLVAFNWDNPPSEWISLTLENKTTVWLNTVDSLNLHQIDLGPAHQIDSTPTYIFNLKMKGKNPDIRTYQAFVHERFHMYQFAHFSFTHMSHFSDHFSTAFHELLWLENNALLALLDDPTSTDKLKDVISIYTLRRQEMSEASLVWEQWQSRIEGMAEYVDVKTFLELPLFEQSPIEILKDTAKKQFAFDLNSNLVDSALKQRYYSVGAIAGITLDKLLLPGWKEEVEKGKAPLDLLAEQIPTLSQEEILQRKNGLQTKWLTAAVQKRIHQEINDYKTQLQVVEQEYQKDAGTDFFWSRLLEQNCASGGSSENGYYLADGSQLMIKSSHVSDCKNEKLDFYAHLDKHPIHYSYPTKSRLKIPVDAKITLDQVSIVPQNLPTQGEFNALNIHSSTFNFSITGRACYRYENQQWDVMLCE